MQVCSLCQREADESYLPETSELKSEREALDAERDRIADAAETLDEIEEPTEADYKSMENLEKDAEAYILASHAYWKKTREKAEIAKAEAAYAEADAALVSDETAVDSDDEPDELTDIAELVYVFFNPYGGDEIEVIIENPVDIQVGENGHHYILDADGDKTDVPPLWFVCHWLRR